MAIIDVGDFALQNRGKPLRFARSSRSHHIGRGRMIQVLLAPQAIWRFPHERADEYKVMVVGEDDTGRKFELIVVVTADELLVIHAMDLRKKWRWLHETHE